MNELNLETIKKELTNILSYTIKFFNDNNIQYFACAGTFLGAIRHKGFIPWDDDIDLFVTRSDYEKLINIAKDDCNISDNIQIVSYELGTDMHPFIKIINKNIRIFEKEEIDNYLWIDIFPLDGVPENEKKISSYLKKCFFMNQIYSIKCQKFKNLLRGSRNVRTRLLKILIKPFLFFINKDKYMNRYLKMIKKYKIEDSKNIAHCVWAGHNRGYFPKEIINEIAEYDFENLKIKGFYNYDLYLRNVYGDDYMQLPPEEKRITHNFKAWYNNERRI